MVELIRESAAHPGLDWHQVRDTVRMLNLAVAQVTMSMRDGEDSTTAMGRAFTALASEVAEIEAAAGTLAPDRAQEVILDRCGAINRQVGEFVVAFQFYDRLSQRLAHVSDSLGELGALVSDPGRAGRAEAWSQLQASIRGRYTMAEERAMFDALMAGADPADALALLKQTDDSDVELF